MLATDSFIWKADHKEGFLLARRGLQSNVEDAEIDVLDLSPERVGVFDIVLFLGLLYHIKHPLLALERAASVTNYQPRRFSRLPLALSGAGQTVS